MYAGWTHVCWPDSIWKCALDADSKTGWMRFLPCRRIVLVRCNCNALLGFNAGFDTAVVSEPVQRG
ncbi:MAG TPA: hypothetical protein DDY14_16125 [Chromatiaceae bacterium]|nr:MAG: hypothetical protein N838_14040 [Thiohalocapsa sp. PB-PSB1]HBG96810.1 hypothetical protein [Chromatiaceae bacterium]HCS88582.1 hypothetical protein [Chromatiaceae bacterium]